MKEEQWKSVEEWEEYYEVSTWGRVRSKQYSKRHGTSGHLLKINYDRNGYGQVTFTTKGIRKTYYVHRLVANAFIPNPNGYTDVNHKDENSSNNHVDNLEWISHKQNMNYGTQAERGAKTRKKRYNTNQVFIKVKHIDTGIVYSSIRQAEKETDYTGADIYDCCKRGEHWEFIGWEYVE